MEQRSHPTKEKSSLADAPPSLSLEIGQNHAISLTLAPPKKESELLTALEAGLRRLIRQNQKRAGRAAWFAPVIYGLTFTIALLSPDQVLMTSPYFYVCVLVTLASVFGLVFRSDTRWRREYEPIFQEVVSLDDVHTVSILVDALKVNYWDIQQTVMDSLIEQLPRLRPDDSELLDAKQRALLCSKLSKLPKISANETRSSAQSAYNRAISFRVAILQAFAQIGDSTAIPVVERLAQSDAKTPEEKRLQEAALECLPLLKLRAELERSNQTLLRPASATNATGDTLLRAITVTQETPSDQLLRPGQPLDR
ncbi:MAG: hypothetical protein JWL77_4024 [Chthonomonadaceae bacterium]|nr:hypothetical protein [Chthonomonadaceae bacterium]